MENEKVVFLFRDQRVTQHGHTRLFEAVEPTPEELAPVLKVAAYFYWKLNRTNNNPDINSGVPIELYKLLPPRVRKFDEPGGGLTPTGPNLYDDTVMGVVADENIPYGFKLTNNTAYDLYPNFYYFDLSDLSIGKYRLLVVLIDTHLMPRQFHTTKLPQQPGNSRLTFLCPKTEEFLLSVMDPEELLHRPST